MRASRSSTDVFVKKEYILNNNIVYLINNIFWNMPFKNPTHARQGNYVDFFVMLVMRIMAIKDDYEYYFDYALFGYYADYVYYADYFVNSGPYQFGSCGSRVAKQVYHHLVGLITFRSRMLPGRRRDNWSIHWTGEDGHGR